MVQNQKYTLSYPFIITQRQSLQPLHMHLSNTTPRFSGHLSSFRISDPIQNPDHLQPNIFLTIWNPD